MRINKHNLLKKSLYSCLAALSMFSILAPAMTVGAKEKPAKAHTKRVIKVPWKKAWNKYAADESGYASVYLYPVKGHISTGNWYRNVNKRMQVGNRRVSGSVAGWNKFFAKHQSMNSLDRNIVTYPAYQHISDAGFNARKEEKGQHWLVDVPYHNVVGLAPGGRLSGAEEADYKRAEMVANLPMSDLTNNQEQALANWAEPVQNGHRLIPSFNHWMKKNHNSPEIFVNNERFSFNQPQGFFDPTVSQNGYGDTYEYNSQTHKYQKIASGKVIRQINERRAAVLQVIDQYLDNVKHADAQNPILSTTTKVIVNHFAQQPGTSQAQAYRDAAKFVSHGQGERLYYSATRADEAQRISKERTTAHDLVNVTNLLSLEASPVFMKMSPSVSASLARYLLAHPDILNKLVNEYHADFNGVAASNDRSAQNIAKQANRQLNSKSNQTKAPQGIISSNPAVIKNMSLLHDEINLLAERQGVQLPKSSTTRLQS